MGQANPLSSTSSFVCDMIVLENEETTSEYMVVKREGRETEVAVLVFLQNSRQSQLDLQLFQHTEEL